jgi:hypothetical protein
MGFAKAQPILRAGGIDAKQRPVLPPRLGRLPVEPVADEGEQLGGFKDHVIDEVHERCDHQQDRHAARDLNYQRHPREFLPRPTRAPAPAAKVRQEALGFSWHVYWLEGGCGAWTGSTKSIVYWLNSASGHRDVAYGSVENNRGQVAIA